MNKLKLVLLIILVAVLVDFAAENPLPRLELKLFKFSLGQVPTFLLAYIGLALGLVMGWVGHVLRVRKKRRQAARPWPRNSKPNRASRARKPPLKRRSHDPQGRRRWMSSWTSLGLARPNQNICRPPRFILDDEIAHLEDRLNEPPAHEDVPQVLPGDFLLPGGRPAPELHHPPGGDAVLLPPFHVDHQGQHEEAQDRAHRQGKMEHPEKPDVRVEPRPQQKDGDGHIIDKKRPPAGLDNDLQGARRCFF